MGTKLLTCSIRLVDHRLDYPSSGVNKPETHNGTFLALDTKNLTNSFTRNMNKKFWTVNGHFASAGINGEYRMNLHHSHITGITFYFSLLISHGEIFVMFLCNTAKTELCFYETYAYLFNGRTRFTI